MDKIKSTLSKYKSIGLDEMDNVKLMNRIDSKFVINFDILNKILELVQNEYNILQISNKHVLEYNTTYYDTEDWKMFNFHQNSKLNRHKIRFRDYIVSNTRHLEVKFKNNKKQTKKKRIKIDIDNKYFTDKDLKFIREKTPYNGEKIEVKLKNKFYRIMLVHKTDKERVTIDTNISFSKNIGTYQEIDKLTIIEIKRENKTNNSDLYKILKSQNIRELRLSKYMLGSILLNPELKSNNYKQKILNIEKILKNSIKSQ